MLPLLPVVAGLLLAASFPQTDQGYLAWVAFVPLIAFVFRCRKIAHAFWGGFIFAAIELFWLMIWIPRVLISYGGLSVVLAWIAFLLMVLLLACYPAAACAVSKYLTKKGGTAFILLFPAVWILFEYLQCFSPFGGFPWLLAGYSQSKFLSIIQIADLTGIFGVSFLILWAGTAVVWFALYKGRKALAFAPCVIAIILIAATYLYGSISMQRWDNVSGRFTAAMLQGNLSENDPAQVLIEKFQNGYVQMADKLNPGSVDLLVLPESPSPLSFQDDPGYRQILAELAGRYSLGLVFNNVRTEEAGGNSRYFNSAYFLDRKGSLTGIYDKIHLVPFGEYIPLNKLFFFVETISKDVGSFYPGKNYQIVKVGDHPANAIICFEAVFPNLVRRFVRKGSQLIINLTNDAWYGDSAAPYQHLAIARFRAVENRRYLLRAANSGISAIIEPSGRIQTSTGLLQKAVCKGHFEFIAHQTFYARYGDVFVFLCAIISVGLWVFAVFHRTAIRKQQQPED